MRTTRHARKLQTVQAPLFPRYLFVRLDMEHDRWRAINGTIGVSRLITADDRPMPVPAGVVETLQSFRNSEGLVQLGRGLREGQKVRVISGPLVDAIGSLERLNDNGRARVFLEIMSGRVPAVLAVDQLEPAA